jgi:hypothetical protein
MRTLLVALLIVTGAGSAKGEDEPYPPRSIYGAGTRSCGEWLKSRADQNKSFEYQYQSWIDGFLSGVNLMGTDLPDVLGTYPATKPIDAVAFYAWIDNYCRQNPLNSLVTATAALRLELAKRLQPK